MLLSMATIQFTWIDRVGDMKIVSRMAAIHGVSPRLTIQTHGSADHHPALVASELAIICIGLQMPSNNFVMGQLRLDKELDTMSVPGIWVT